MLIISLADFRNSVNKINRIENESDPEFDKLEISLLNHRLVKCPACLFHFDTEEDCFEHILDHFENTRNFLFQRVGLIFWLRKFVNKPKNEPPVEGNNVEKYESMNDNGTESAGSFSDDAVKVLTFSCRFCNETFFNEHQLGVHLFVHVQLLVPAIDTQLKCPLCDKFFCKEESCLSHIFCHLQVTLAHKKGLLILKWLAVFFASTAGEKIIFKYDYYATKLNSPLLSKILVSEVIDIRSCKFCKESVSSIFDLRENHYNCGPSSTPRSLFCLMCNFSAVNEDVLLKHIFAKHVACYCGFHGENFSSFQQHSVNCTVNRNGVLCPICRTSKFTTVGGFKEHIEENGRKSCSMNLKKNKWKCLLCETQSRQKEMFSHILSEHVSCMCNYKTKNFKSFCIHTSKCGVKHKALLCPICGIAQCSTEKRLKDHIAKCLPWKNSKQYSAESNTILGAIKIKGICELFQHNDAGKLLTTFKRQDESLPMDFLVKRKKFNVF